MKALFQTDDAWSSFLLRITLGCVMFPHGAQKLLGWYGGGGFSGTMGFFTEQMGMPALIAFLIIIGESFGSVGLLLGPDLVALHQTTQQPGPLRFILFGSHDKTPRLLIKRGSRPAGRL